MTSPRCPTATDALVQALALATDHDRVPLDCGTLAGAQFGRFAAEGEGWYWQLTISRQYASDPKHYDGHDQGERRIRLVIESWNRDVARYQEPPREDG